MRTKLDVLRETMKAKGCEPLWCGPIPSCSTACPSFLRSGPVVDRCRGEACCAIDNDVSVDDCYPMISAMVEALQVPHE